MPQKQYQWMVIVGSLGAWIFGWGTGSNDVANAFGTSVGSGALTLKQAIIIATIFEFTGAMVLGRVSTSVIAGGIADIKVFQNATDCNGPMTYAYGMMWTLILGGLWQGFASRNGLNVSATHSIIAGIIGFSLQFRNNSVLWITNTPANVGMPIGGIVPIVVTWVFAPVATGVASSALFLICRTFVLRSQNSFERAFMILPILVFFTFWINIYFVFTKGAKKTFAEQNGGGDDWTDSKSAWVAAVIAAGVSAVSMGCLPYIRGWVIQWDLKDQERARTRTRSRTDTRQICAEEGCGSGNSDVHNARSFDCLAPESNASTRDLESPPNSTTDIKLVQSQSGTFAESLNDSQKDRGDDAESIRQKHADLIIPPELFKDPVGNIRAHIKHLFDFDYGMDFFEDLDNNVEEIHNRAEKFDPLTEKVFGFLQIFSATCVMFAHGAGEVGYMAGPFATIYDVYETNKLSKTVNAPTWIVVISALSLVSGLATYGRNVVKAMGKELAKITPSRGFCAETCTSMVIMVASQYGLPTSSSQAITGGIVGIGIVEGVRGVNWRVLMEQFSSWVMTMFVMGLGTAMMFAQGHNAP